MPNLFVQRGKPMLIKKTKQSTSKQYAELVPKQRGGMVMGSGANGSLQRMMTPNEYDQMVDTEKRFAAIEINGGSVGGVVHHKKSFKPLKLKF
jgi:hypothetical protein